MVGLFMLSLLSCSKASKSSIQLPNIIIILADDLGYNDLSCFGSKNIVTPNLDAMAREGFVFNNFLTASNVCSPSRASLLTGRYPQRNGVPFAVGDVYSDLGLQDDEITIPEILKGKGYSTAAFGKWHLGLPLGFNFTTHEGFNKESEFHPNNQGFDLFYGAAGNSFPGGRMPLIENDQVINDSISVAVVTDRYTEKAIEFISENRKNPFFIYFAHTRPHAPLIANPAFAGRSKGGVYGDMVEELDASVGLLMKALKELGLEENTLVIFTSDNGATVTSDQKYGSNAPLRGGKASTWDGGHKVPTIFYWPGKISPGKHSNHFSTNMDLLPTISYLSGTQLPGSLKVDGNNLWPLIEGTANITEENDTFFYYNGLNLQAVKKGKWKLHLPREEKMLVWWESGLRELKDPLLFDLQADPTEVNNIAAYHPEVVAQLVTLALSAQSSLGDWDRVGSDQKDIKRYLNDRAGLQSLRTQQNHQNLGKSKLDDTTDSLVRYYWKIAVENRRNKIQSQKEK